MYNITIQLYPPINKLTMVNTKRLIAEFNELNKYEGSYCKDAFVATYDDVDITKWKVIMQCPTGSVFHDTPLETEIKFPDNYPFRAPTVRFINKPAHPNIMTDGSVCVDILKEEWSPILSAQKIYVSIMSLLLDKK